MYGEVQVNKYCQLLRHIDSDNTQKYKLYFNCTYILQNVKRKQTVQKNKALHN